jgi:hypothetical protein
MDSKQMFPLSSALKLAMGKYASAHDMSVAQLIRESVAKTIGFNLEAVESHRKYASEAERIAAQRERNLAKKALEKKLYDEYMAKARAAKAAAPAKK